MKTSRLFILIIGFLLLSCSLEQTHGNFQGEELDSPISPPNIESSFAKPLTTENFINLEQVARFGDGYIHDVAVSPDQSTLAVYVGERINIYDADTFDLLQSIPASKYIENSLSRKLVEWNILTFTSDSKTLVYSDGIRIILWDLDENQRLTSFYSLVPEWSVVDITLSPNEDRIMVTTMGGSQRCDGRDMNFALYNVDGRLIFDRYTCADYSFNNFHFTSDEKVLFIFASIMTEVYPTQTFLIDGVSGRILEQTHAEYLDYQKPIPNLELLYDISPNGELLAFAIYNLVNEKINVHTKIIDIETKNVIHEQDGLVEFFVDQGEISWKTDSEKESDAETEVEICNFNKSHQIDDYNLLLSGSEHAIISVTHFGQIHSIELWNITSCEIDASISFPAANSTIFSPDGRWLASTDGYHAYVWEVQTSNLFFMVDGKAFDGPRNIIQFNADGSRFIVSSYGLDNIHPNQPYQTYIISIFDIRNGQLLRELKPDSEFLKNIVATPEKDLVIAQDSTNQYVWDIETGQNLATLPSGPFVFSSQSGFVWIAPQQKDDEKTEHKIFLYNYRTGEQVRELATVSAEWIRDIYRDDSGTKLLAHLFLGTGKENGDAVIIFDTAETGMELLSYNLPWQDYKMSAFGNYFATYGSDGYVHLWNYETDLPVLTLWGNHPNRKVSDRYKNAKDNSDEYVWLGYPFFLDTWFLDESILITKGESLRFWDITSGYLLAEMNPDYSIDNISISPDRYLVAVTGKDGLIRLWGVPNEP